MTRIALDGGGGVAEADVATTPPDQMGLDVNVGIRPEDFEISSGEAAVEGEVGFVEALGEVTLLYFAAEEGGREPVIAKLPGIHADVRGRSIRLCAQPSKVQIFHQGRSLRVK